MCAEAERSPPAARTRSRRQRGTTRHDCRAGWQPRHSCAPGRPSTRRRRAASRRPVCAPRAICRARPCAPPASQPSRRRRPPAARRRFGRHGSAAPRGMRDINYGGEAISEGSAGVMDRASGTSSLYVCARVHCDLDPCVPAPTGTRPGPAGSAPSPTCAPLAGSHSRAGSYRARGRGREGEKERERGRESG